MGVDYTALVADIMASRVRQPTHAAATQLFHTLEVTCLKENDETSWEAWWQEVGSLDVAGWCVHPSKVAWVRAQTKGAVITVANFPEGEDDEESLSTQLEEARAHGADAMDVVWPAQWRVARKHIEPLVDWLSVLRKAWPSELKVIFEVSEIADLNWLLEISLLALNQGIDFLKTSTGVHGQASLDTVAVMAYALRESQRGGLKVAGGVNTWAQAQHYYQLVQTILGEAWPTPSHFRIGTSRLHQVPLPE